MPASIGVNLRVTGHCRQGGRKYMEDFFSVAYQQTQDEKDLEYAFFGIFDGHGGMEAATFAKEHLMESIVRQKNFWSDKDEDVLKAIKDGYINTHYAMWREQEKWPKTASGLPSTAGTTASVAFIRRGKIYIGHVGDSGIILGFQEPGNPIWQAKPLTEDHKPENQSEMSRIEQSGGKVVTKSGVPRVVWNRPRIGHKGPVRRSTPIDEIPFLAVARSLGDLWSYNSALDEFVVSPDPDTVCIPINAEHFRCLIFGTDGLWNMISPASSVSIVQVAEQHNERTVLAAADSQDSATAAGRANKVWINPSKCLVERALERWNNTRMRADNTSVITLMLDPPGPPRAEVIKNQRLLENRRLLQLQQQQQAVNSISDVVEDFQLAPPEYPENGLEILTMYEEEDPTIPTNYQENPQITPNDKQQFSQENTDNIQLTNPTTIEKNPETNTIDVIDHIVPDNFEESKQTKAEKISERRLTEENLNKIHRQVLNDMKNNSEINQSEVNHNQETDETTNSQITTTESCTTINTRLKTTQNNTNKCTEHFLEFCKQCIKVNETKDKCKKRTEFREVLLEENKQKPKTKELNETIQINEVSSSSSDKLLNDDQDVPCSRCTRSQDNLLKQKNRKSLRSMHTKSTTSTNHTTSNKQKRSKLSSLSLSSRSNGTTNATSPMPRRKTRSSYVKNSSIINRKTFCASKREHSDSEIKRNLVPVAVAAAATPTTSADSSRHTTIDPPPQKLRRSQSCLGPRDFTLRSQKLERNLRNRSGTNLIQGHNSLVTLSAGSINNYKKISSTGKNFTPVKQAIQTRNRVKRLNK